MNGNRLRDLRIDRALSLSELGDKVDKSASTISRYENNSVAKWDPDLIIKIARALDTSAAYLMGMTDDPNFIFDVDIEDFANKNYNEQNDASGDPELNIFISDDEMSPEIPYGAFVKIRQMEPREKIQLGSFYYIEFDGKKCFRMAIEDNDDGIGFLPNDMSERKIAYDPYYVNIIGKAVSMKVFFDDIIEYV